MQKLKDNVYIHSTACLYGAYHIKSKSSVWPYVVMRAEEHTIQIGEVTNIQDGVIIHTGYKDPVKIGNHCTVGHRVLIHGATIGDNCVIGSGAMLLDGAVVEDGCVIPAGAIIREGEVVKNTAGEKMAKITAKNKVLALSYYENAMAYSQGYYRLWSEPGYKEKQFKLLKQMIV